NRFLAAASDSVEAWARIDFGGPILRGAACVCAHEARVGVLVENGRAQRGFRRKSGSVYPRKRHHIPRPVRVAVRVIRARKGFFQRSVVSVGELSAQVFYEPVLVMAHHVASRQSVSSAKLRACMKRRTRMQGLSTVRPPAPDPSCSSRISPSLPSNADGKRLPSLFELSLIQL